MKKKQGNKSLKVALVVALLLISTGFAVLSTTLNINGNTQINVSSWDVKFLSSSVSVTTGSVSATAPTVTDTTVSFAPTLSTPGDFYEFTIQVKNNGSIDAKVSSITPISLTTAQQKYATATATYSDGTAIAANDQLAAGATKTIKIRVAYKSAADISAADLPSTNQTVEFSYGLTFGQD